MRHGMAGAGRSSLVATIVAGVVLAGALSSLPANAQTAGDVTMIPWVELNFVNPNDPADPGIAKVVDGLRFWSDVTTTAVVTTQHGKPELYSRLYSDLADEGVEDLTIIPGLKLSLMMQDGCSFNDPEFWIDVAQEVSDIEGAYAQMERTMPKFVLESETLTECYYKGLIGVDPNCACDLGDPDLGGLEDGVAYLASQEFGVDTYYWHPGVLANEDYMYAFEELCVAVQAGFDTTATDIRFDNDRVYKPNRIESKSLAEVAETAYQTLLAITDQPTAPLMSFYSDPAAWSPWYSNQINSALCNAGLRFGFETVWIYTGFACFDGISYDIVYGAEKYDPDYQCCPDLDCDGEVGLDDLWALLAVFNSCFADAEYDPWVDLNGDGCVDLQDLSMLLAGFGMTDCNLCWPIGVTPDCQAP